MATHSSILAWEIPWTEEPGGLQSMGHKELDTTEQLTTATTILCYYCGYKDRQTWIFITSLLKLHKTPSAILREELQAPIQNCVCTEAQSGSERGL